MGFSTKKKVSAALVICVAALCCLFPWLQRENRFPHVGTWHASSRGFSASYSFDKNGVCTTNYQTRKFKVRDVPCDYTMDGVNAKASYSHASWTEKGVTLRYFAQLTPEENGRVLRVELQKWDRIDSKNGKVLSSTPLASKSQRFVKDVD